MRGMKLVSFLVAPVQRVMRYSMLLEEVLKKTPKGHPDEEPLRHAVANLKSIAQYVNENKRGVENLAAFQEFLSNLKGCSLDIKNNPRRVLLKQCDATVNTASNHVHLFLFTDLLFITKQTKHDTFTFKNCFFLSQCSVSADGSEGATSFTIDCPSKEKTTLIFENGGLAGEWFKAILSRIQARSEYEKLLRTNSSMKIILEGESSFSRRENVKYLQKQRFVLERIVKKETEFRERLNLISEVFLEPMKEGGYMPILRSEKVNVFTSNIDPIRSLQPAFIESVKGRLSEWGRNQTFSDVLKGSMDYINSFVQYLLHYRTIVDTFTEANATPSFQVWLIRRETEKKMSFEQEIALPLHHFYDLFLALQEFCLLTTSDNPDGEVLKTTMAQVTSMKDDFLVDAAKNKSIPAVAAVLDKFTSNT